MTTGPASESAPASAGTSGLALAPTPADGALHGFDDPARRTFKALNTWFMIPVLRAGLGAWMGSPIGGCILLLRVRGRRSGVVRETPLSYIVADGSVWVMAGFGPATQWYRNLLVDPAVEVILPGRTIAGRATEIRAPALRAGMIPKLVRATGLPSLLAGVNPWTSTPEQVLAALDFVPLLRIDADEGWLDPGPDDPGGHAWVWRQALAIGATVVVTGVALGGVARLLRSLR